jgi:UDP:flavonoid glycosyltransferase YjiC (YdhE family)
VDLFARHPLEAADATSRPVPCRYVTFAAHYAAPLVEEVGRLRPALIVYDTFAVVGRVLGRALGIPYVNVCVGHNMSPARAVQSLEGDPRVAPSEACLRAVAALRDRWGLPDAGPFAYFTGLSPFLNLYGEPPEFLRPEDRAPFEPLAFFGSLPAPGTAGPSPAPAPPRRDGEEEARLRVYASFGTVVWRYYEADARRALTALSAALGERADARVVVSLGGHALPDGTRTRLARPNVRIETYVDQWRVLQDATVFVTHHGLNSTHEAVFHGVPMLSYPFSANQQGLAARCRELGLAIPLVDAPRGAIDATGVHAALAELDARAAEVRTSLGRARAWELDVIRGRDAVIRRILALAGIPPD